MVKTRKERRISRKRRVRAKVVGTSKKPRLSVFKSNTAIYAQVIDDEKGVTIASSDSRKAKGDNLTQKAKEVGGEIAKKASEKKVKEVVFDRGGYAFAGTVKSLAEGAREGGLKF
jgi:large subunit ribosomal protein L18